MNWSQHAWQAAEPIYNKIIELPFVKELAEGILDPVRFEFYLCQDALYLNSYSSVLAHIASRCNAPRHRESFLKFASDGIAVENALHESFLHEIPVDKRPSVSPTCMLYISVLKSQSYMPVEVEAAAVLPCFWIYREVGREISRQSKADNPYAKWIDTYSDVVFDRSTQEAIKICDEMAANASLQTRQQMTDIFVLCAKMEWLFWHSAWNLEQWKI